MASDARPNAELGSNESAPERVTRRHQVAEALASEDFGDVLVVSQESADRVLTPARREIIDALATHEVGSQRELADLLGRDAGNVKRDLAVLIDEGVVAREKAGRSYRPYLKYDTVIAEPVPTAGVGRSSSSQRSEDDDQE